MVRQQPRQKDLRYDPSILLHNLLQHWSIGGEPWQAVLLICFRSGCGVCPARLPMPGPLRSLQGAPYGYAPLCDGNSAMDGFRFWKTGFWSDHLQGRPYHISALYVVDLDRFR